jgi:hypothetical protein
MVPFQGIKKMLCMPIISVVAPHSLNEKFPLKFYYAATKKLIGSLYMNMSTNTNTHKLDIRCKNQIQSSRNKNKKKTKICIKAYLSKIQHRQPQGSGVSSLLFYAVGVRCERLGFFWTHEKEY